MLRLPYYQKAVTTAAKTAKAEATADSDAKAKRVGDFAGGPPPLTMRQAELYGLVSYDRLSMPPIIDTPS